VEKKDFSDLRRHERFKPDEANACALMELNPDEGKNPNQAPVRADLIGLVFSQSSGGCGVTVRNNEKVKIGDRVRVQVGASTPHLCEIVWVNALDDDTMKLGVKYIQ